MKLLQVLVLSSLISLGSFAAEEQKWEINGNYNGGGTGSFPDGIFSLSQPTTALAPSTINFGFQAGVHYSVLNWLQVGLLPSVGLTSISSTPGASAFNWAVFLQVTANFPMDAKINDAFFVDAKIGYSSIGTAAAVANPNTGLGWGVDVGKRFTLFNNVSWKPSLGLLVQTTAPTTPAGSASTTTWNWVVNLLQVSLVW